MNIYEKIVEESFILGKMFEGDEINKESLMRVVEELPYGVDLDLVIKFYGGNLDFKEAELVKLFLDFDYLGLNTRCRMILIILKYRFLTDFEILIQKYGSFKYYINFYNSIKIYKTEYITLLTQCLKDDDLDLYKLLTPKINTQSVIKLTIIYDAINIFNHLQPQNEIPPTHLMNLITQNHSQKILKHLSEQLIN